MFPHAWKISAKFVPCPSHQRYSSPMEGYFITTLFMKYLDMSCCQFVCILASQIFLSTRSDSWWPGGFLPYFCFLSVRTLSQEIAFKNEKRCFRKVIESKRRWSEPPSYGEYDCVFKNSMQCCGWTILQNIWQCLLCLESGGGGGRGGCTVKHNFYKKVVGLKQ